MSEFVLTVLPDGRCLLTTERELGEETARAIVERFRQWRETPDGVALIGNCRTQRAETVDLDLPE